MDVLAEINQQTLKKWMQVSSRLTVTYKVLWYKLSFATIDPCPRRHGAAMTLQKFVVHLDGQPCPWLLSKYNYL